jgi:hypothetical protein
MLVLPKPMKEMKKLLKYITVMVGILVMASCGQKKDDFGQFSRANFPTIPVTFPNATVQGFDPFIVSPGVVNPGTATQFNIQVAIPANSGRTIQTVEIKGGTTAINAGTLNAASVPFLTPIATTGLGTTTVTITTSLASILVTYPALAATVNAATRSTPYNILDVNSFREIALMFRVTLDNGDVIIPVRFRIRTITNS